MATRCVTRGCSQLGASSSAARAFLQLTPPRYLHTAPLPVLDFLLPGIPPCIARNGSPARQQPRCVKDAKRSFTSSSMRRQTSAIFNPRRDEDGNDMSVDITARASNRLKEIMTQDSNPNLALRIQVESGGCHGFQYLMSLTSLPPVESFSSSAQEQSSPALNTPTSGLNAMPSRTPASSPLPDSASDKEESKLATLGEDDTVFAADDGSGAKVVMDGPSLELLKGSKVDFTMELIGSQFKIVDNPLATSSCGCGTSFDIKV